MIVFRKPVAGVSGPLLTRFLSRAGRAAGLRGRVMVLITGNRELRALNLRFRGRNEPTDVLSFPAAAELGREIAGDLAISAQIATANATRLGHPLAEELKVLILHGVLHLAGFDHENDAGEMARREERLRRELRLPVALIGRSGFPAGQAGIARPSRKAPSTARKSPRGRT